LSTGLRINTGKDDPAGLIVSESFRAQISGIDAAVRNSQDAINYAKTAEGALGEVHEILGRMRETSMSSTIETHLALVNNRMNEVMKVLTIVTSIFIPLSFIAGVYGMNFRYMPELDIWWFYPLIWIVFITIPVVMLALFRRSKWI